MDKRNETEKIGWSFFPLETVIDKISTNGKKIKQKEYIVEGKYPVIDQGADFIGGYTNDESKVLRCDLPVVVFGDHTKILKLVRFHFVPGADGVKVLLPHKSILPELFVFFIKILLRKIPDKGYARHFQHLEKSEIPILPLPEQRAIVAKLEQLFCELDNGIACLKKAQEQLKVYRQAVLKQAFEGELTKAWREQQTSLPSAQELLETIKSEREQAAKLQGKKLKPVIPLTQSELHVLPALPKEWKWVRISDIAQKIQIGPFGSQLHSEDYIENGIPLINPKHIKDQKLSPRVRISIDKANSLPQYFLEENDIIVGRRGEMGRTAPVLKIHTGWFCGTGSLYIRLGQSFIAKLYSLILSERRIVDYLEKKSRGTTMANLNSQIINSLPIQLISPQEQSQIVEEIETRLSVCDNIESTIRESLEKAEALRQSILKKAFEGKLLSEEELQITRNAPDWEPAEKLLERIRAEKRTARNKH